jgi:HlyD family secretion protein
MLSMRQKLLLAGAAVLIVAIAAAGLIVQRRQAEVAARSEAEQRKSASEAAARTADIVLSGTIGARETTPVAAPMAGIVKAFHADVGDMVYEGQLLAEIENQGLQASHEHATLEVEKAQTRVNNLEGSISAARLEASRAEADAIRARAEFDKASRHYTRQKLLVAEGATPRNVFEKAEKDYQALQSESDNLTQVAKNADERVIALTRDLDNARKLLEARVAELDASKTRVEAGQVTSSVSGTVVSRRGDTGGEVHPTMQDLFQIATDTSVLTVVVEPSPADLARIKAGQSAAVYVADVPDESLSGRVISVESGKVVVEFANPSALVKPGQTAQVRIKVT